MSLVEPFLGGAAFPVRGILFDKIPGANWKVPWHQDLTIAVSQRIETDGFGPWSVKADVLHVQSPVHILENMLTLRLHLDDCGESNGPLKVLPGSHRSGRLSEQSIEEARRSQSPIVCTTPAGGVLLMWSGAAK
jgi:ectoine hydroxylase-related dioxygenase (phytanoyl-CoA dioxygenase family)